MCSVYLKDENKITSAIAKSYVLYVAIQLHYRIAVSTADSDLVIKVSACHFVILKCSYSTKVLIASNIKTNNLVVSIFLGSLVDGSIL